jgi:hypothetical protein
MEVEPTAVESLNPVKEKKSCESKEVSKQEDAAKRC